MSPTFSQREGTEGPRSAWSTPCPERGKPCLRAPQGSPVWLEQWLETLTEPLHHPDCHPGLFQVQSQISKVWAHRGLIQPGACKKEKARLPGFSSHLLWKSLESHSLRVQRGGQYDGNNHCIWPCSEDFTSAFPLNPHNSPTG